jgi:GNAT superfamily N-acetyltransferase
MDYTLIEAPSEKDRIELSQRFQEFINSKVPLPDESEDKRFIINVRDRENGLVAGVLANAYWDGLEIDILWVAENYRKNGLGAELLEKAEQYGKEQGSVISFLKTVEAKDFYEKYGYQVFGVLEDRPIGSLLYHMKKRLD